MYCTNCGKQIIDTARFCNYCGSPVAANFTAPSTPVNPNPPITPISPSTPIEPAPVSAPIENSAVSAPIESAPISASVESAPVSDPIESTSVSAPVSQPIQDINNLFEDNETSIEAVTAASTDSPSYDEEIPSLEQQTAAGNNGDNENHEQTRSEDVQTTAYTKASEVQMPSQPPVPNVEAGGTYSLPAPSQIPMNGEGAADIARIPGKPAKPLPERKYTLGHIMMCLAAVAIMAIVAGVFAGLYFSVV